MISVYILKLYQAVKIDVHHMVKVKEKNYKNSKIDKEQSYKDNKVRERKDDIRGLA